MPAHQERSGGKPDNGQRVPRPVAARPLGPGLPGPGLRGPGLRGPADVLALQAAVGNRAVSRLLAAEEEQAQGAADAQPGAGVEAELARPGRPLDAKTRKDMEARIGADFSDVRLHTGPEARSSADEIGARAYTSGSHVVIGAGGTDKHTLAHELTHVVQQRQSPVDGTDNGAGLSISDPGDRFEREAETNAARVMRGTAPEQPSDEPESAAGTAVQRMSASGGSLPSVQRRWKQDTMSGDDPQYTADSDRAGTVEVHNLEGTPLGPGTNDPSVEPMGWKELTAAKLTKNPHGAEEPAGNPYRAVRMHLFNGRLGGPGNDVRNLAPGPGQMNSAMSGDPETKVKNLVRRKYKVWLKTTVKYLHNNVNGADFTSVIPDHIAMSWGIEGDASADGSWSKQIPLPVDPLNPLQEKRYRGWKESGNDLVLELDGASDQVRAQVLGLVPTMDLKIGILTAYPSLFKGASAAGKVDYILSQPDAGARVKFLAEMGVAWDKRSGDDIYQQALKPLADAGRRVDAEEIARAAHIPGVAGRGMAEGYGEGFFLAVGSVAAEILERDGGANILKFCKKGDYRFKIFEELLRRGSLSAVLMQKITNDAEMFHWLDGWALHRGYFDSGDRIKFIKSVLPGRGDMYERKRGAHDRAQESMASMNLRKRKRGQE